MPQHKNWKEETKNNNHNVNNIATILFSAPLDNVANYYGGTWLETTGIPASMASSGGRPNPSSSDG